MTPHEETAALGIIAQLTAHAILCIRDSVLEIGAGHGCDRWGHTIGTFKQGAETRRLMRGSVPIRILYNDATFVA